MALFDFHFPCVPVSTNFFSALSQPKVLPQIPINFHELAKRPKRFYWMVGIRRKMHENPELGFEEFKTGKLIRVQLDQMGIPYKYLVAETGVGGYIRTSSPNFVAIRADIGCFAMQVCFNFWNFQLSFLCLTFFSLASFELVIV